MDHVGDAAERLTELFRDIYLTFHRRDGKHHQLSGASSAVLTHLALSGPLTVGEAAAHLERAQSVVSEIVDGLARRGLLERERDPTDRRRTLVWLTDEGQVALHRDRQVLDVDLIARALATLPAGNRRLMMESLQSLTRSVSSADETDENTVPPVPAFPAR